jgi:hypothetical protein
MMTEISYSGYRFPPSLAVGAEAPSLLAGLIVDAGGNRMTPAHATKRAKRYRYYWRRLITCKHRKGCASRREISRGWCSTGLGRFSPPGLRSLTRSHRSILRLARLMRPYAMHSRFQSDGVPPLSILNNIKDDLQRSSEKWAIDEWRPARGRRLSIAETNCAKWRRESVPVGLREKGFEAPAWCFCVDLNFVGGLSFIRCF